MVQFIRLRGDFWFGVRVLSQWSHRVAAARAERAIEADRRDANQDGWDAELGSSSGSSAGRGSERQRRLRCPARRGVGAACTAWVAGSTELPDPPKASGCPGPHVYPAPSVWHEARAAAGSAASDCWRHLLDGRCIDTSIYLKIKSKVSLYR